MAHKSGLAIQQAIAKLIKRQDLDEKVVFGLLEDIKERRATDSQIGGFLVGLTAKEPTIEEIAATAKSMREKAVPVRPKVEKFIDTCGTGGGKHTFNVSTANALLVSTRIPVCKHGSRSLSSKSGSADVQEALGIDIHMTKEGVEKMVEEVGYGFMYAPYFHPIMGRVVKPEFELGIKTIFYTIIGPLISPADERRHILGAFKVELVEMMSKILAELDYKHALVAHGLDGFDEISVTGKTSIGEVENGKVKDVYDIEPEDLGLRRAKLRDIVENNPPKVNAKIIKRIFEGKDRGPRRDFLLANAAGSIVVGDVAKDLKDGVEVAANSIDDGLALRKLNEIAEASQRIAKIHPSPVRL